MKEKEYVFFYGTKAEGGEGKIHFDNIDKIAEATVRDKKLRGDGYGNAIGWADIYPADRKNYVQDWSLSSLKKMFFNAEKLMENTKLLSALQQNLQNLREQARAGHDQPGVRTEWGNDRRVEYNKHFVDRKIDEAERDVANAQRHCQWAAESMVNAMLTLDDKAQQHGMDPILSGPVERLNPYSYAIAGSIASRVVDTLEADRKLFIGYDIPSQVTCVNDYGALSGELKQLIYDAGYPVSEGPDYSNPAHDENADAGDDR